MENFIFRRSRLQEYCRMKPVPNSVYNQLLYVPLLAYKVSFSTNKVGLGQLIKAVISRYGSGTEHATGHTRDR
jgi:hypothetical protein